MRKSYGFSRSKQSSELSLFTDSIIGTFSFDLFRSFPAKFINLNFFRDFLSTRRNSEGENRPARNFALFKCQFNLNHTFLQIYCRRQDYSATCIWASVLDSVIGPSHRRYGQV